MQASLLLEHTDFAFGPKKWRYYGKYLTLVSPFQETIVKDAETGKPKALEEQHHSTWKQKISPISTPHKNKHINV